MDSPLENIENIEKELPAEELELCGTEEVPGREELSARKELPTREELPEMEEHNTWLIIK